MNDQLPHPVIKHVIYLMLENRGFDHFMGSLYPTDGAAPRRYTVVTRPGDDRPFMGLSDAVRQAQPNPYPVMPHQPATPPPEPPILGARSPKRHRAIRGSIFPIS